MNLPRSLCCLWLLLCWGGNAAATTFTADVDRKDLYVNEHVLLTLELANSETRLRAEGVSPNIDLTVLSDDFEIGIPRADFRFNIDRNRGRSSSSITVELFPRDSGRLTIPAFTVDGLSTRPIEIEVHELPEDAREEVFARSGVVNDHLHLREQTLVWLDLYHRVSLDSARLGGPIETRPSRIELHLLPQETRSEVIDGIEYQVTRTAWAISPLSGEAITVFLPDIWVETRAGRQWRLPFGEETIAVSDLPGEVAVDTLIGKPSLTIDAPKPVAVGEVTPWEITLRSTTAMNALPAELPFAAHDAGIKIYMDAPERSVEIGADGEVESVAVYRGSIMALAPGEFLLPAIELPWFDPGNGRIETLVHANPVLQVTASALPATLPQPAAAAPDSTVAGDSDATPVRRWQLASLVLALLWLSTAGMWWWRTGSPLPQAGNRRGAGPRPAGLGSGGDAIRDRLLAALGSRTLEEGLLVHERRYGSDEALRETVRAVQRHCYHPDGTQMTAEELATRVDRTIERLRRMPPPPPGDEAHRDPWSPASFTPARRD